MEPSLYPILHPRLKSCSRGARHTSGLTLNQLHKGCNDNGNRADHPAAAVVSPSHTVVGLTRGWITLFLHDIKTDAEGARLTLTNLLILPRCQTHFQAISLSQLVKVPDNLHAPLFVSDVV